MSDSQIDMSAKIEDRQTSAGESAALLLRELFADVQGGDKQDLLRDVGASGGNDSTRRLLTSLTLYDSEASQPDVSDPSEKSGKLASSDAVDACLQPTGNTATASDMASRQMLERIYWRQVVEQQMKSTDAMPQGAVGNQLRVGSGSDVRAAVGNGFVPFGGSGSYLTQDASVEILRLKEKPISSMSREDLLKLFAAPYADIRRENQGSGSVRLDDGAGLVFKGFKFNSEQELRQMGALAGNPEAQKAADEIIRMRKQGLSNEDIFKIVFGAPVSVKDGSTVTDSGKSTGKQVEADSPESLVKRRELEVLKKKENALELYTHVADLNHHNKLPAKLPEYLYDIKFQKSFPVTEAMRKEYAVVGNGVTEQDRNNGRMLYLLSDSDTRRMLANQLTREDRRELAKDIRDRFARGEFENPQEVSAAIKQSVVERVGEKVSRSDGKATNLEAVQSPVGQSLKESESQSAQNSTTPDLLPPNSWQPNWPAEFKPPAEGEQFDVSKIGFAPKDTELKVFETPMEVDRTDSPVFENPLFNTKTVWDQPGDPEKASPSEVIPMPPGDTFKSGPVIPPAASPADKPPIEIIATASGGSGGKAGDSNAGDDVWKEVYEAMHGDIPPDALADALDAESRRIEERKRFTKPEQSRVLIERMHELVDEGFEAAEKQQKRNSEEDIRKRWGLDSGPEASLSPQDSGTNSEGESGDIETEKFRFAAPPVEKASWPDPNLSQEEIYEQWGRVYGAPGLDLDKDETVRAMQLAYKGQGMVRSDQNTEPLEPQANAGETAKSKETFQTSDYNQDFWDKLFNGEISPDQLQPPSGSSAQEQADFRWGQANRDSNAQDGGGPQASIFGRIQELQNLPYELQRFSPVDAPYSSLPNSTGFLSSTFDLERLREFPSSQEGFKSYSDYLYPEINSELELEMWDESSGHFRFGTARLDFKVDGEDAELQWVERSNEEPGTGRILIEQLIDYAAEQGLSSVSLTATNQELVEYYQRLGFQLEYAPARYMKYYIGH